MKKGPVLDTGPSPQSERCSTTIKGEAMVFAAALSMAITSEYSFIGPSGGADTHGYM